MNAGVVSTRGYTKITDVSLDAIRGSAGRGRVHACDRMSSSEWCEGDCNKTYSELWITWWLVYGIRAFVGLVQFPSSYSLLYNRNRTHTWMIYFSNNTLLERELIVQV